MNPILWGPYVGGGWGLHDRTEISGAGTSPAVAQSQGGAGSHRRHQGVRRYSNAVLTPAASQLCDLSRELLSLSLFPYLRPKKSLSVYLIGYGKG